MLTLSKLRTVWQEALARHILDRGFPFPEIDVESLSADELERRTCEALKLANFWTTRDASPRTVLSLPGGNSATGVSEVKFLPARPDWIITVSKGIWSVITCWDISGRNGSDMTKHRGVAEWTPRQTILTGVAVNSDSHSEAYLAVSMMLSGFVLSRCSTREASDVRIIGRVNTVYRFSRSNYQQTARWVHSCRCASYLSASEL